MRLVGELSRPQFAHEAAIDAGGGALDELDGVGQIERARSGDEIGQLGQGLAVLVGDRARRSGRRRRRHPLARVRRQRPHAAHLAGEEIVVADLFRHRRWRRRRGRGRRGRFRPPFQLTERLMVEALGRRACRIPSSLPTPHRLESPLCVYGTIGGPATGSIDPHQPRAAPDALADTEGPLTRARRNGRVRQRMTADADALIVTREPPLAWVVGEPTTGAQRPQRGGLGGTRRRRSSRSRATATSG